MFDSYNNNGSLKTPRVLAITGGKGGVGKTSLAVNLAIALSRNGSKVCLFDADTALGNINIMLGIHPAYTLEHLLSGEKVIQDVLVEGPEQIHIVPGASGAAQCAELNIEQQQRLIHGLEALESSYDYMIIDTAAGISPTVLHFIAAAQVSSVVITPEPTSLTDAFSLLKVLRRRGYRRKVQVVVNMAPSSVQAEKVYRRFSSAVAKYLDLVTEHLGSVWMDESMRTAVTLQKPVALFPKNDPSARSFYRLAERVDSIFSRSTIPKLAFSAYWQKIVDRQIEKAKKQILEIQRRLQEQQATAKKHIQLDSESNVSKPQVVDSKPPVHQAPIKVVDLRSDATEEVIRVEENNPRAPHTPEMPFEDSILELAEKFSQSESESQEVESFIASVKQGLKRDQSSGVQDSYSPKSSLSSKDKPQELADQLASLSSAARASESFDGARGSGDRSEALSDSNESEWMELRVKLNRFFNNPNTTPEQATTLLSNCIFSFGDRLGNSAVDLLHGLLSTIDLSKVSDEQRSLLANDYERLLQKDTCSDDTDVIKVEPSASNGSEEAQAIRKKVSYDAKEFGSQESLAERIKRTGDQPLENLLESIKYASLVGASGDEEAS